MSPSTELVDLVNDECVTLETIRFRELGARRVGAEPLDTVTPEFSLGIDRHSEDESRFRLRLRCEVHIADGSWIICEPEADYLVTDESRLPLTHTLILEYANEVAVMALIPYLRQGISDISQRVFGTPLVMPVMARGAIHFEMDEPAAPDQTDGSADS